MNDDVDKAINEIRARGERLLDGFEELILDDAELTRLLPHLEELKHQQDDILRILAQIKSR